MCVVYGVPWTGGNAGPSHPGGGRCWPIHRGTVNLGTCTFLDQRLSVAPQVNKTDWRDPTSYTDAGDDTYAMDTDRT